MTETLSEMSDAALVVGVARWRQECLAEAYRRHGGAVFSLALRVVGDRAAAEDVTQLVFSTLWDGADRFDPDRGSLRSYLLTLGHHRAVDMVRADDRRRQREERLAAMAEAPYDLEHEVWDLAVADEVGRALATLPAGERQAIEMAYFGGHTYREVAALLGQPEGTIKGRIRHGLERLRAVLTETPTEVS